MNFTCLVVNLAVVLQMSHFEQELVELKKRASSLSVEIGTPGEMQQLRRDTEEMMNFRNNIKITTQVCLSVKPAPKSTYYLPKKTLILIIMQSIFDIINLS